MKVALVHDWLDGYRGGERVLEAMMELYPDAPIYTLFYEPDAMPESFRCRTVIFPKRLQWLRPWRKALLPVLPSIMESFGLERYDLVISSSSCVAKGALSAPDAHHICYIHSPMRYIWDQRAHYFGRWHKFAPLAFLYDSLASRLRIWDAATSTRVDHYIANSHFVAKRVKKFYGQNASVLPPPVDCQDFDSPHVTKLDYCLVAGAFVSYKRFDLAIKACNTLGLPLIVAGSGAEESKLRKIAGPTVKFVIKPSRQEWVELFQKARLLLFPGVEDFGITAIEALAAGTPLIAFRKGGALDFVNEGVTGEFFNEESVESLCQALEVFDDKRFSRQTLQDYARSYSKECFKNKLKQLIQQEIQK